jgi:ABC-type cobalamin/Fe3+-siderophores transport system ATPase subunit
MSDLALNASGINHRYGNQQALIDITFSLPKGTRCGLIGPDGAGKSSLLGLIAGVKKLQEGTLEVLGGPIDRPPPSQHPVPADCVYAPRPGRQPLPGTVDQRKHPLFSAPCLACPKTTASNAWPTAQGH